QALKSDAQQKAVVACGNLSLGHAIHRANNLDILECEAANRLVNRLVRDALRNEKREVALDRGKFGEGGEVQAPEPGAEEALQINYGHPHGFTQFVVARNLAADFSKIGDSTGLIGNPAAPTGLEIRR